MEICPPPRSQSRRSAITAAGCSYLTGEGSPANNGNITFLFNRLNLGLIFRQPIEMRPVCTCTNSIRAVGAYDFNLLLLIVMQRETKQ